MKCPRCSNSHDFTTERRPNGHSLCNVCRFQAKTTEFRPEQLKPSGSIKMTADKKKVEAREFWATQIIGAEDGKYFMSEDEAFVENMSMVEIKFKVIEYSALASRDEEIRKLKLANARSVDAAFHALLEMSAWMGIPENKRHSMIEELMENVKFCADVKNQLLTQTEGG